MKRLTQLLALLLLLSAATCTKTKHKKASWVLKHAHFSFQLEDTDPSSSSQLRTVLSSGMKLRLQDKILFTNIDLVNGYIRKNTLTGYRDLWLIFSSDAASRLKDVTANNKGKRLAILVDGKIWMAPRIIAVIPNGKAVVTGGLVQDLIDKLARKIASARKK